MRDFDAVLAALEDDLASDLRSAVVLASLDSAARDGRRSAIRSALSAGDVLAESSDVAFLLAELHRADLREALLLSLIDGPVDVPGPELEVSAPSGPGPLAAAVAVLVAVVVLGTAVVLGVAAALGWWSP